MDDIKTKKKVNRNVQEEPQAEVASNPRHQEEKKNYLSVRGLRVGHTHLV